MIRQNKIDVWLILIVLSIIGIGIAPPQFTLVLYFIGFAYAMLIVLEIILYIIPEIVSLIKKIKGDK